MKRDLADRGVENFFGIFDFRQRTAGQSPARRETNQRNPHEAFSTIFCGVRINSNLNEMAQMGRLDVSWPQIISEVVTYRFHSAIILRE